MKQVNDEVSEAVVTEPRQINEFRLGWVTGHLGNGMIRGIPRLMQRVGAHLGSSFFYRRVFPRADALHLSGFEVAAERVADLALLAVDRRRDRGCGGVTGL